MKYNTKEVKALNEKFDRTVANEMVTKRRDELMKNDSKLTKKEARTIAWAELKEAREALKKPKRKYETKYDRGQIMKDAWKLAKQLGKDDKGKFKIGDAIKEVWKGIKAIEYKEKLKLENQTIRMKNMKGGCELIRQKTGRAPKLTEIIELGKTA